MFPGLGANLVAVDEALRLYANASAAVAVLLREGDGLEVFITERARRETDPWSGQWSFPGGRRKGDEPLLGTAYRETEEEVGLSLRASPILGCLAARSPANRPELLVLPFVFEWDRPGKPNPGPEVASFAWIPLTELPETRTTAKVRVRGHELEMPAFVHGPRTLWGFTYRVLEDLLKLLAA